MTELHRKGYPTILIFHGVLVSDEPLRSVKFTRKDMCDVSEISIYPCPMSASIVRAHNDRKRDHRPKPFHQWDKFKKDKCVSGKIGLEKEHANAVFILNSPMIGMFRGIQGPTSLKPQGRQRTARTRPRFHLTDAPDIALAPLLSSPPPFPPTPIGPHSLRL